MYGWWLPYWTAQLRDLFGQLIESALRKRNIYLIYLIMVFVVAHGFFGCSMQDLVPRPAIEPGSPALGVWSLSLWTPREVPASACWRGDLCSQGLGLTVTASEEQSGASARVSSPLGAGDT